MGEDKAAAALGFHEAVIRIVERMAEKTGVETVILSGGCFANRLLLEGCVEALKGKRPCCVLESGASSRRRRACFRSGMVWYEYSKRKEIICA